MIFIKDYETENKLTLEERVCLEKWQKYNSYAIKTKKELENLKAYNKTIEDSYIREVLDYEKNAAIFFEILQKKKKEHSDFNKPKNGKRLAAIDVQYKKVEAIKVEATKAAEKTAIILDKLADEGISLERLIRDYEKLNPGKKAIWNNKQTKAFLEWQLASGV